MSERALITRIYDSKSARTMLGPTPDSLDTLGVEILQLLKDNGADLTKKDRNGLMPADIMLAKHDVLFDGPRG